MSSAGQRANWRGIAWQRRGALLLREHGWFPHAEHVGHGHGSDLRHVGDRVVEMTLEPWANLAVKLRQARDVAEPDGFDWEVWKPMPHQPWGSVLVEPAMQGWRNRAELDSLRRAEFDAADAWERGYAAGWEARGKREDTG